MYIILFNIRIMSDRKDLKLDLNNEAFFTPPANFTQPPPLIRERQSDYGIFDEHFENDVITMSNIIYSLNIRLIEYKKFNYKMF